MEQEILAVIPARGGSKRVPQKNIREFAGRPLIAYTIKAALDSGLFSHVVVSTDSQEIADIAVSTGAEVPFLRDPAIADDHTPVSAATADALERLDPAGTRFGAVAQLMPNCPLRTSEDVVASHESFVRSAAPAQISVFDYGWLNPWWAMTRDEGGRLTPLFEQQMTMRSQDLPSLFCPSGAVWWVTSQVLRAGRTFHVSGRTGWVMPWERAVDIDDEADWRMAEAVARIEWSR